MKNKIIVNSVKSQNYKCDITQPYSYADINISGIIAIILILNIILFGTVLLIILSKPSLSESPNKMVPIIILTITIILLNSILIYLLMKNLKEKKKFDKILGLSNIIIGKTILIVSKNQRKKYFV